MSFSGPSASAAALLALALASCSTPPVGVTPTPESAALAPADQGTSPTPGDASAIPDTGAPASPAPPAMLEISGIVEFNGEPVEDAVVTAYDLLTGQPIPLEPVLPDARTRRLSGVHAPGGRFRMRLRPYRSTPSLHDTDRLMIELVAESVRGRLTAIMFDDIGVRQPPPTNVNVGRATLPVPGAAPVTSASLLPTPNIPAPKASTPRPSIPAPRPSQTAPVEIRITPASTIAAQSYEGVLKLLERVPAAQANSRKKRVIDDMTKLEKEAEAKFKGKPHLASKLLQSIDPLGKTKDVMGFRQTVQDLGVFDSAFKSIQGHLQFISDQTLRSHFGPIEAGDFPLDQVVISRSGFLGFSGQRAPIQLGQPGSGNGFVPTPPRGGGGNSSATPAPVVRTSKVFFLDDQNPYVYGLAFLRGRNELAIARRNPLLSVLRLGDESETTVGFGTGNIWSVAQIQSASRTLFVGTDANADQGDIFSYAPDTGATVSFSTFGPRLYRLLNGVEPRHVLGAGRNFVYTRDRAEASSNTIEKLAPFSGQLSGYVLENGASWLMSNVTAIAVHDPNGAATPTLFVGTEQGEVFMLEDGGASRTLVTGGNPISGLAFATPSLYISRSDPGTNGVVQAIDVNQSGPGGVGILSGHLTYQPADGILQHLVNPRGLALDDDEPYLYIGTNGASRTIIRYPLPLQPPPPS